MPTFSRDDIGRAIERCLAGQPIDGVHLIPICKPLVAVLGTMLYRREYEVLIEDPELLVLLGDTA